MKTTMPLSAFRKFIVAQSKKYNRQREAEMYEFMLDTFLAFAGDIPVDQVTPELAEKFRIANDIPNEELVAIYRMRHMKEIFDWAVELGFLNQNPFDFPMTIWADPVTRKGGTKPCADVSR